MGAAGTDRDRRGPPRALPSAPAQQKGPRPTSTADAADSPFALHIERFGSHTLVPAGQLPRSRDPGQTIHRGAAVAIRRHALLVGVCLKRHGRSSRVGCC
jgi:hypothetical protein